MAVLVNERLKCVVGTERVENAGLFTQNFGEMKIAVFGDAIAVFA